MTAGLHNPVAETENVISHAYGKSDKQIGCKSPLLELLQGSQTPS